MSEFLNKTPFFKLFLAFAAGVVVYELLPDDYSPFYFFLLPFFLGLLCLLLFKNKKYTSYYTPLFTLGITLVLIAFGYYRSEQRTKQDAFTYLNQSGIFGIELLEYPIEKKNSVLVRVKVFSYTDSVQTHNASGKAILYLSKDSSALALAIGDKLLISTRMESPTMRGNPEEFDYGKYLKRKGFEATTFVPSNAWQKIGQDNLFSIRKMAAQCRNYLLDIYRRLGINGDEFGMLAALTLGYKDALSPELRESFATTGTIHVLAVSGLHVGIIYVVFGWMLLFMDYNRRTERFKPILLIALLWAYAFITGLPPSVSRAALMCSFIAFGRVMGKQSYIYNSVFASAFLLLLIRPMLLFDLSFQLSYLAVIGILYFQPKIANFVNVKNRPLKWLWELTSVSIAAQLGTAPIALYYFHQFPNYFLLSNFIVIPLATIILYLAVLLFLVSPVPYLNLLVAFVLKWVLKFMHAGVAVIETFPNSLTKLWINGYQLLLLYLFVVAVGFFLYRQRFKTLLIGLGSLLAFILIMLYNNSKSQYIEQLTIFSQSKGVFINSVSKQQNIVITTDSAEAMILGQRFWQHYQLLTPKVIMADTNRLGVPFIFDNEHYFLLTHNAFRGKKAAAPLKVDYLILGKGVYPRIDLFEEFIDTKQVILSADISDYYARRFEELGMKYDFKVYHIGQQGAFIKRK